jgi:UDP-4-amino-4,6-dideoxy-N-acetyl-beta-L-altrosamine transaminase
VKCLTMRQTDGFLPYGRQSIDDEDIAAVVAAVRSDYLTTGPRVGEFEADFARMAGAAHAVSCSSGTAALHLAALALSLEPGDVVIVPSLTFLASANMARYVGADVQFADVDPDTGLMTPETLRSAIAAAGGRAKAVVPVHLNGQCCDMASIGTIAREHGLAVVEDACHALGGRFVGACHHSDMTAFSFHPVKTIAAGEGGLVTTNYAWLAERLSRLRNHGMTREPGRFVLREQAFDAGGSPNPWYYEMLEVGFNYRLSDIHAALARSQLAKLDRFMVARRALVTRYDAAISALRPAVQPLVRVPQQDPAWHLYVVLIDFDAIGMDRAAVMRHLREQGIGTQVHYLPVHRQPYYRERYGELAMPGADAYYARALSLPLYAGMHETDVDRVVGALRTVVPGA